MRRIRSHLTYANLISTFCLFLLLGGAAYAAFHLPKNSVKSKNIAPNAAKGVDIQESSLGTVPRARSASPDAFALVSSSGVAVTGKSKGIRQQNAHFQDTDSGTYCSSGLAFHPRGGQATIDYDGTSGYPVIQMSLGALGGCPAGSEAVVYTVTPGGVANDAAFHVAFYR